MKHLGVYAYTLSRQRIALYYYDCNDILYDNDIIIFYYTIYIIIYFYRKFSVLVSAHRQSVPVAGPDPARSQGVHGAH